MYQTDCNQLLSRFEEGVVTISFNRPQEENLINYAMLMAMRELFNQAARDDKVRAVVLKGEGSCFCGGDDWQNMGAWPEEFAHRKPGGSHGAAPIPEQETIKALRDIMKPTIALLHGSVLGLGLDLAAVCDLRVASTDASIGDPRIRQGRASATGITYLLPRLIGLSQASRILLMGEILTAEEAIRIQLVHQLIDTRKFAAATDELIKTIAGLPTRAYEVHKLQVLPQLDMSFDAAMTHCLGVRQTHVIEDREEGAKAWRERRDPVFKGR